MAHSGNVLRCAGCGAFLELEAQQLRCAYCGRSERVPEAHRERAAWMAEHERRVAALVRRQEERALATERYFSWGAWPLILLPLAIVGFAGAVNLGSAAFDAAHAPTELGRAMARDSFGLIARAYICIALVFALPALRVAYLMRCYLRELRPLLEVRRVPSTTTQWSCRACGARIEVARGVSQLRCTHCGVTNLLTATRQFNAASAADARALSALQSHNANADAVLHDAYLRFFARSRNTGIVAVATITLLVVVMVSALVSA